MMWLTVQETKQAQVIRKVIVEEGSPQIILTWLAGSGLAGLTPEQQALDADPDGDG